MNDAEFIKRKNKIMIRGAVYSLFCVMAFVLIIVCIPLGEYGVIVSGVGSLLIMIPFLNWMSKQSSKLIKEYLK